MEVWVSLRDRVLMDTPMIMGRSVLSVGVCSSSQGTRGSNLWSVVTTMFHVLILSVVNTSTGLAGHL